MTEIQESIPLIISSPLNKQLLCNQCIIGFYNEIAVNSQNQCSKNYCIKAKTKFAIKNIVQNEINKNTLIENLPIENESYNKFKTYSGPEYLLIPDGFIISSLPSSPQPLLRAKRKKNLPSPYLSSIIS